MIGVSFNSIITNNKTCKEKSPKSSATSYILDKLSIVTDNLETYQGRDTVITLLHYWALILADICTYYSYSKTGRKGKKVKQNKNMTELGENFVNMFVQLSNCRVMLRLFDDFNAIRDIYRFFARPSTEKVISTTISSFFTLYIDFPLLFLRFA